MKSVSTFAFTILISVHCFAFSLGEFGITMSGEDIKEKIKTISESCKKGGDKEKCRNSKKEVLTSGIKLPDVEILK